MAHLVMLPTFLFVSLTTNSFFLKTFWWLVSSTLRTHAISINSCSDHWHDLNWNNFRTMTQPVIACAGPQHVPFSFRTYRLCTIYEYSSVHQCSPLQFSCSRKIIPPRPPTTSSYVHTRNRKFLVLPRRRCNCLLLPFPSSQIWSCSYQIPLQINSLPFRI